MPGTTSIEWTERSWNAVTGCWKVSTGCKNCYAEREATGRLKGSNGYPGLPWTKLNAGTNVVLHPDRLDVPLRWRKPSRIFVNSMSDLFLEEIPVEFVASIFATMAAASWHTFQILTKRPEYMRDLLSSDEFWADVSLAVARLPVKSVSFEVADGVDRLCLPNVWLGVSIENRKWVGRADALRDTPAAVRWISAEPLVGPLVPEEYVGAIKIWNSIEDGRYVGPPLNLDGIDWLVVGGESGPNHRRLELSWIRDLREATRCSRCRGRGSVGTPSVKFDPCVGGWVADPISGPCPACRGSGRHTAFFVKQLGGYRPGTALDELPGDLRIREYPNGRER